MDLAKFKALLDEQNTWPEYYTFKFVVKTGKKDQVLVHLAGHKIDVKESSGGKYTAITSRALMSSSEDVVAVYEKMKTVEGIMSL